MPADRPVALITGTRKGIGRYLACHLAGRGYAVEGCSREPAGWKLKGYTHHLADVANEEQVKAMLADIRKRHGRLDVLINNAGIASMNHTLLTPTETAQRIWNTNCLGAFVLIRESVKLMQKRRFGRIVNLGSVATPLKLEGEAIYASSKAALVSLTQILAYELAGFGITVNLVGPTPVDTDLIRGVPQEKLRALTGRLAIKRLGRMDDISNVIDFFIKPESEFITGQVLYLGGV